jgi:hypothetical protein
VHGDHGDDGDELDEGQRGRGAEVEQLGGLPVDLDLEGRPPGPAEHEDDAEGGEAEEEHDGGGGGDGRVAATAGSRGGRPASGLAPSTRADSSSAGSRCAHRPPTVRTTTA